MDTGDRTSYNLRVRLVSERVYKTNRRGKFLFYCLASEEGISQVRMLFCSSNQINLLGKGLWFGSSVHDLESPLFAYLELFENHEPGTQFNHLAGHELPPCFLCFRAMPLLNFLKPCPYHQQQLCRQWQELLLVLH